MAETEISGPIHWLDRTVAAWVSFVTTYPKRTLIIVSGLLIASMVMASGLRVDTDSSKMLSAELDFQKRTHALNAAFPALKNTIVVVVRADTADAADFVTSALVRRLEGRPEFEAVFSPSTDPFLVRHGLLYQDTQTLDRQLSTLSRSSDFLAELREDQSIDGFFRALARVTQLAEKAAISSDALEGFYREAAETIGAFNAGGFRPFAWADALGGQGTDAPQTLRTITLKPKLNFKKLSPAKAAIQAARNEISELPEDVSDLAEIGLTGDPVLRGEELRSVVNKLALSFALSVALVALMLWMALRSFGRLMLALGVLFTSLVVTAGLAAVTVGALNLISVAFIVLMVGLGIDFAIHFLAHLAEASQSKDSAQQALTETGRSLGGALAIAALTTATSFLVFTTTDFVGMAQLGLIGAIGVVIAMVFTLTLVPAAITLRPALVRPTSRVVESRRHLIAPNSSRAIGVFAFGIGAVSLFIAPHARFDADPMALRDPNASSVQAYDWLRQDPDRTPLRLSVLTSDLPTAIALAAKLEELTDIRKALTAADLVPSNQFEKLDLIDLAYPSLLHAVEGTPTTLTEVTSDPIALAERLELSNEPAANALAATLRVYSGSRNAAADQQLGIMMFLYFPLLIDRLTAQLDAGEVTFEDLPKGLRERFRSEEGTYRVEAVPAGDSADPGILRSIIRSAEAVTPDLAGPLVQIDGASNAVAGAMLRAVLLALIVIGAITWVCLRRVGDVLAVMLPLLLAGSVTLAFSAMTGVAFNYANVIVLPLMIGIGVDSGIHLAFRTRRAGGNVFATSTPRAILFSALTTIGAFATLALSDHRGTASMGVMLTVALIAAIGMIMALTPHLIALNVKSDRP